MTITSVSNLSVKSSMTSALQSEQTTLTQLTAQLSSQKQHTNLTDYSASDARNLINLQSTATQKEAYISVINTISSNLAVYDTTLTDLETIAAQAQSLANNSPTYSTDIASNVATQTTNFLRSVTVDLNQEVNGRFIYAGSRYTTPPAQDLSTLPTSTLSSTMLTDNLTVPTYDAASTLNLSTSGQAITVGGTVGNGQTASVTVNGTAYTYNVQATDTPTLVAAGLAALIPGASNAGAVLNIQAGDVINAAAVSTTNAAAYSADQAVVDTGYTVHYGITSNDQTIQKLVAGLRFLQAAGNSSDAATYKAYMAQATSLLSSAVTALQSLHTGVANNINIMTSEKEAQKTAISNLTDQVANIQQIDVTQVSTEITSLETILQASYSATGSILKLSITSYL